MGRKGWLVVGVLVLSAAVLLLRRQSRPPSQPAAPASSEEARGTTSLRVLSVQVRSRERPFAGAQVQLFDAELGHLVTQRKTDARGVVDFALDAGAVLIVVEHPELERRAERVELIAARTEHAIDLDRGVTIRGIVRDEGERPVANVVVSALSIADQATRSKKTDARGRFMLAMLSPGSYRLEVATGRHRRYTSPTLVLRKPGSTTTHNVKLDAGRVLAGRVVDDKGQPVEGASVGSSDPGSGATTTDPDGRFELLGLGDEPINVFAAYAGFAATHERGLRAGVRGVELRLEREAVIRGRVVWPAGLDAMLISACHHDIHFEKELCLARVQLRRPDTEYTLSGLPAGPFEMVVEADGLVTQRVSATLVAGVVTELTPTRLQLAP